MFPNRFSNDAGGFEITSMPSQSQLALCHSFFVHSAMRGKGHGHLLKATQRATLQGLHYDYAICTVAASNAAQKAVLTQAGWKKLAEFKNHRSCEITELWGMVP